MEKKDVLFIVLCVFFIELQTATASSPASLQIEPVETQKVVETANTFDDINIINVKHSVKGNDVYIECIIPGFSFVSDGKKKEVREGEGHIHLHVDDQKMMDVNQAAFILKGLPKGKHNIKLELVHNNQKSYGIFEEFTVDIE